MKDHIVESGIGSESINATTLSHIPRNELYRKRAVQSKWKKNTKLWNRWVEGSKRKDCQET